MAEPRPSESHLAPSPPPRGAPLFAFQFSDDGSARGIEWLSDVDIAPETGFSWVHVDLSVGEARRWIAALPVSAEVHEAFADPDERGRMFWDDTALYGHLRDLRDEPEKPLPHADTLCVFVSARLVVTGRLNPLVGVNELRRRIDGGRFRPQSAFALITGLFDALNDQGFDLIERASRQLRVIESDLLRRRPQAHREALLDLRRRAIRLTRDMAYKRAALVVFSGNRPPVFPKAEFRRLLYEIDRYAALVEDCHEFADHCRFLLDEARAQVAEETNRNLYVLTLFSVVFMPATLFAGLWGMNVEAIPFAGTAWGFWQTTGLIAGFMAVNLVILRIGRFF